MARRRSLLALVCVAVLPACMQPYSTPQPFAIETGGKPPDDTTGVDTTAAETTVEPGTSTGAVTATTGTSTGGTTTTGTSTGEATTEATTEALSTSTSTGTTAADTTTGDPHDVCIESYEFGDECGECICDKCLDAWQTCNDDEGCRLIRACAVKWECVAFECDGPCASLLFKYGGIYGPHGSLAVLLGQCAVQKCGIYCKV